MRKTSPFLIASFAGLASAAFAFVSSAGAEDQDLPSGAPVQLSTAVFAGGCFWCVEADFDKLEGVSDTTSGYTGGKTLDPTYKQVSRGGTGHYEAVRVTYDPSKISYAELTDYFMRHIDPSDGEGQFCDKGESYRSAIFVARDNEKAVAKAELVEAAKETGLKVETKILAATTFWPAEEYHQDYYKKNPLRYSYYRKGCGRDARLAEVWAKPNG